jgi:hypothetical protein
MSRIDLTPGNTRTRNDEVIAMNPSPGHAHRRLTAQRGATTLAVTLLLLAVTTVIVLFATNTAYFESRTANNESRARLAEQAAEYNVNLAGEYIKSQLDKVVSSKEGGWLEAGEERWAACKDVSPMPAGHPCLAEVADADGGKRNRLYFTVLADDTDGDDTNDVADLIAAGSLADVGGDAAFPVNMRISALLCRIDTSGASGNCDLFPSKGNNIAVTLVATANLPGEGTVATVKETWGSYSSFSPSAAVPLVAAGLVEGLGNAQIVAAPNAGGTGMVASVWSPKDVDIEDTSGGGVGSVSTCHLGGFLGHGTVPEADLLTTCAGTGNTGCGCPGAGDPDFLSGHTAAVKVESIDILDVDGGAGDSDLPDITYFPGNGMDDAGDPSDDNLFEAIFNVPYVAEQDGCNENDAMGCSEDAGTGETDSDCGAANNENCAVWAMREELGFEFVTCAELEALGEFANGLYYVEDSSATSECTFPKQLGSPEGNVSVVVNEKAKLNASVVYGMVFVRSDKNEAVFSGQGSSQVFGSVVVQGNVKIAGGLDLIYYDWAAKAEDPERPPPARYFGRVSGSWLDDDDGI